MALQPLTRRVGGSIKWKISMMGVFLDIQGAFDNSVCEAAERFGVDKPVIQWIRQMMQTRRIEASLEGASTMWLVGKGCP